MTIRKYTTATQKVSVDGESAYLQVDDNGNLRTTGTVTSSSTAEGTTADAAYTGSGSASIVSILKGLWASFFGVLHDAIDSGAPVKIGGYASANAPTAVAAGDRVNAWYGLNGETVVAMGTAAAPVDTSAFNIQPLTSSGTGAPLAILNFVWDGTNDIIARGDKNGMVVQTGLSSTFWNYNVGTTGILSNTTTAVTIKASAGANTRNYIDALSISTTAFGAAVPIVIRDGAGGSVLWSHLVPTGGYLQPINICFPTPLKGTAATLLEVATPTANTSGTVFLNVQGHTGP